MEIDVEEILARNSDPNCPINKSIHQAVHSRAGKFLPMSAANILCEDYDPEAIKLPTKVYYPPHYPASWKIPS